jgi:hypothetical protein
MSRCIAFDLRPRRFGGPESLPLWLPASAVAPALSTKVTTAASNIIFLNTASPRYHGFERFVG